MEERADTDKLREYQVVKRERKEGGNKKVGDILYSFGRSRAYFS